MPASLDGARSRRRSPRLDFLVGTSYTGSTLLALLLNAHPEVASVGELNGAVTRAPTPGYRCSCGALLERCEFWKGVSAGMDRRGVKFGPQRWDTSFTLGANVLARQILVRSLGSDVMDHARDRMLTGLPGWGPRLREIGDRNAALLESIAESTDKPILVDTSKAPCVFAS